MLLEFLDGDYDKKVGYNKELRYRQSKIKQANHTEAKTNNPTTKKLRDESQEGKMVRRKRNWWKELRNSRIQEEKYE